MWSASRKSWFALGIFGELGLYGRRCERMASLRINSMGGL